jgi:hypothetical protein
MIMKQRNRHTGKINAYKRYIINKGTKVQDSIGRTYYLYELPTQTPEDEDEFVPRRYSLVKDPESKTLKELNQIMRDVV